MPAPMDHAKSRGWIETIGRHIPGFKGYLEKEYRRDADALLRSALADDLQKSKPAIDEYAKAMVLAAKLDALAPIDSLRAKMDKLIARIRGAMQGYSGMFDLVKVDVALLDQVYQHDLTLTEQCEQFHTTAAKLKNLPPDGDLILGDLRERCDKLDAAIDHRTELLKGLG